MDIRQITKQLPTGADKIIAERIGNNSATVRKVFYGQKVKHETKLLVIKAITELLKETKENEIKVFQELQAVANI
ncbi:hypothetical protein [Flavobacterium columnare]|uniref:hypothetical protein n=1 Tax=Flavobacterium columnare TaxID=996 RepID=UPI000D1A155C|nr:hypothetical protein [Flavobacterium columnare]PTD14370.1 hypothetical protein C6N29_07935 [Flavobacterium columnare]